MNFKDKTMLYLLKRSDIADDDFNKTLQFVRYHNVDEVDYLELIIKKVRKDITAEILLTHCRALNMPAGSSLTPG